MNRLIFCFLLLVTQKVTSQNYKLPIYDTANNVYITHSNEVYKTLKIEWLNNRNFLLLTNENNYQLISEDGVSIYKGEKKILELVKKKNDSSIYALVKNDDFYRIVNISTRNENPENYIDFFIKKGNLFLLKRKNEKLIAKNFNSDKETVVQNTLDIDEIEDDGFENSRFIYYKTKDGQIGLIDAFTGREIINFKAQKLIYFGNSTIIVRKDSENYFIWDFKNKKQLFTGSLISLPRHSSFFCVVRQSDKNLLVDTNLNICLKDFDEVVFLNNKLVAVKRDTTWQSLNNNKDTKSIDTFTNIFSFKASAWGFSKKKLAWIGIAPLKYKNVNLENKTLLDIKDDLLSLSLNNKYFIYKIHHGKPKFIREEKFKMYFTRNNDILIYEKEGFGLMTLQGTIITQPLYDLISDITPQYFLVIKGSKQYFIDKFGFEYIM